MEDHEQILQQIAYLCDKRKHFYGIMSSNSAYLSNIQNNNLCYLYSMYHSPARNQRESEKERDRGK